MKVQKSKKFSKFVALEEGALQYDILRLYIFLHNIANYDTKLLSWHPYFLINRRLYGGDTKSVGGYIYMYTAVMNESYNVIHAHLVFWIAPEFLTMIQCYYK